MQKREKEEEEREEVSHVLYWFAEYLFGCDRLIMKNVVINSRMFCFVGYEKMKRMRKRQQVSETC